MANNPLPRIEQGQRACIAGRSGSGKSTLACWMLTRSPGHWLILNPKHTKAYAHLPDVNTMNGINFSKLERSIRDHRFTVVNPTGPQSTPENMDAFVEYLHGQYQNLGLCADELYTLHVNGQAGQGLIGWLTRGRELGQSFLGLTQRPSWISRFLFSESTYIGEMSLNLKEDRKRMYEMTGQEDALIQLPPREWLWYDVDGDTLRHLGPVPLVK